MFFSPVICALAVLTPAFTTSTRILLTLLELGVLQLHFYFSHLLCRSLSSQSAFLLIVSFSVVFSLGLFRGIFAFYVFISKHDITHPEQWLPPGRTCGLLLALHTIQLSRVAGFQHKHQMVRLTLHVLAVLSRAAHSPSLQRDQELSDTSHTLSDTAILNSTLSKGYTSANPHLDICRSLFLDIELMQNTRTQHLAPFPRPQDQ